MARRRARRRRRSIRHPLSDKPFRRLQNPFAPVTVLSEEKVQRLHDASVHILEKIGIEFLDEEALDLWEEGGARVDRSQQRVWIDEELLMGLVNQAPSTFTVRARNPAHNVKVGGNHINFATVGAAPYYSDLERGRAPGTLADYRRMIRLSQMCGPIHIVEGLMVEPQDVPVPERHLDKWMAQMALSDKAQTTAAHGREVATDYVEMAAIVFGGKEEVESAPVLLSNVNANSPLRFDERMLGALIVYSRHNQPCIVTPFILAGAMSPITMAAAIAQQNAEALAGIALVQIVRPGCPVVYGGFTTNVDMKTGSPAFGTPEGALALFSGAQLARHYGLPYRGSGGLNNAKVPDAQAAYETQMSLWPAVMAHANIILHSAGWLEAGLVCSMEKFIVDVEGLAMMHHLLGGLEIDDETLALESIATVGHGGHHFGTPHTLSRFQDAFYAPIISDRQNYDAWEQNGADDTAHRAHKVARELLETYEPPALDRTIDEALREYVERRRRELSQKE